MFACLLVCSWVICFTILDKTYMNQLISKALTIYIYSKCKKLNPQNSYIDRMWWLNNNFVFKTTRHHQFDLSADLQYNNRVRIKLLSLNTKYYTCGRDGHHISALILFFLSLFLSLQFFFLIAIIELLLTNIWVLFNGTIKIVYEIRNFATFSHLIFEILNLSHGSTVCVLVYIDAITLWDIMQVFLEDRGSS